MDDLVQNPNPVLPTPVDNLEASTTPFQPERQAINELITSAPEFTPAPVISPAEEAKIAQETTHQSHVAENQLGEIAVTQAEQDQLDAEDLVKKAPAIQMFSNAFQHAKDKHVGKYFAAVALGLLPAIAESKFGIHGLREAVLAVAPGGVFGGALGASHEPVTGFVNNFTDVDNLSSNQSKALKAANIAAGAIIGTATGLVGNSAAERINAGGLGAGFRMVDEYIPAATVAAVKGVKAAIKSGVTSG